MKRFVRHMGGLLAVGLVLSTGAAASAAGSITVQARTVTYSFAGQQYPGNAFVNGTSVVPDALYASGTTYVPIRLIAQMLGLSVSWKSPDVVISSSGSSAQPITTTASQPHQLTVQVRAAHIVIDGKDVTPAGGLYSNGLADVPLALYYGGTTYVPLRFVDNALGLTTNWDGTTHTITISQATQTSSGGSIPGGSITLPSGNLTAGGTLAATLPVQSTSVSWWLQDTQNDIYPIFGATTSAINTPLPQNIPAGSYTLYAQDNAASPAVQYTASVQLQSSWTPFVDTSDNQLVIDPFFIYNWEDMTPLFAHGVMGQGETLALFEQSDLQASDLSTFDVAYGLPQPDITVVDPYGDPGVQTIAQPGATALDETTLDVEWAHAMAPYAHILLYLYPDTAQPSDMASAIADAQQRGAVAFSSSFAWVGDADAASESEVEASVKSGQIAVFAASGDHGPSNPVQAWPATSPYVISVGGTEINGAQSTTTNPTEAFWNQGTDQQGVLWEGGYGVTDYPIPSWQQAVVTGSMHTIPDVSFLARDALVYEDAQWIADGGTSLASPCWAGIWTLEMQLYTVATGRTALPVPAPQALYEVGTGDATTYAKTPGFFPLPSGQVFDPQLGFGVPDVSGLAVDLSQLP